MPELETATILTIGGAGLLGMIIIDALVRWIRGALARRCRLIRALILPDVCRGACPPGQACVALTTRPYGIFFTQAATCGCRVPAPGGGAGGGGGAGEPEGQ